MNESPDQEDYQNGRIKFWGETIGLHPFRLRMRQAKIAIRGEDNVPPALYDLSSLKQLRPRIGLPLWFGKQTVKNKVIISNCFNHTPTPIELGWSVRVTQTRDFRGGNLTYDSHNGTDFAVPIGTELLAPAPGRVVRVISEFNRGGLKIFIDHGEGLMSCFAHLARAHVSEGDVVQRAERIAITGYSGLDSLVTFPFGMPHTHFNCWLNGEPVDPFPFDGQKSIWRAGDLPLPHSPKSLTTQIDLDDFQESKYDAVKVKEVIDHCLSKKTQEKLNAYRGSYEQAGHTIAEMNYYPTRFPVRKNLYDQEYPRPQHLDLPFRYAEFDGVVFADEI